jgi:hypothetical protein
MQESHNGQGLSHLWARGVFKGALEMWNDDGNSRFRKAEGERP